MKGDISWLIATVWFSVREIDEEDNRIQVGCVKKTRNPTSLVWWVARVWRRLTVLGRRGRQAQALSLSTGLNAAIRANDADSVARFLQEGAVLGTCTLDQAGYHTPLELAHQHGSPAVVALLERYWERQVTPRRSHGERNDLSAGDR